MKIGKLNRQMVDFTRHRRMKPIDLWVLIILSENMWMGIDEMRHELVTSKQSVVNSLKKLYETHYIRIARRNVGIKRISRKYSITQKGRDFTRLFFNSLNQ